MRQVEPWLDITGWGATWPSLQSREPEPAQGAPTHSGESAGPAQEGRQSGRGDCASGDEGSGDDDIPGELDDEDGEDPEQPEEDEDYNSEEDVPPGRGDEADEEEEEEGHNL